jgi:hypothetical protein
MDGMEVTMAMRDGAKALTVGPIDIAGYRQTIGLR